MDDKRLAAAFFLPAAADRTVPDLLARIGATHVADRPAPGSGLVDCRWAGFAAQGFLDRRLGLDLLGLLFFQSEFLELLPGDAAGEDRSDRLVSAFTVACEALSPVVALVATHLHQADVDVLWELAPAVLEQDVDRLAQARFGVLFVNADLGASPTAGPDRDRTWIANGELIFAGRDSRRWW